MAARMEPSKAQFYLRRLTGPKIALMSFIGRFHTVRQYYKRLAANDDVVRDYTGAANDDETTIFPQLSPIAFKAALERDGASAGITLPEDIVQAIRSFAEDKVCYAERETRFRMKYSDKAAVERANNEHFHMAQYGDEDVRANDLINSLADDSVLRAIAAQYFRTEPCFTGARLFWTFASEAEEYDVQKSSCYFHYDHDDFACLRFFFYITDVDEFSGPHHYVRTSHRIKSTKNLLSRSHSVRSYEEICAEYGEQKVVSFEGPAGYGFVEDAHCFHQATRPEKHDRLVLQLTFAINDYKLNTPSL